jgi:hypothetical protein
MAKFSIGETLKGNPEGAAPQTISSEYGNDALIAKIGN